MEQAARREVGHDHEDMNSDDNTGFAYGSQSDDFRR